MNTAVATTLLLSLITAGHGQIPYKVEEFRNQTLMYYENYGTVRLTGATWQLITYLPLKNYDLRHDKLQLEIGIITNLCKNSATTLEMCSRLDNIFKVMFQEISLQREKMYESIGRYTEQSETTTYTSRKRRGLINFVGSAMKTLFGVCDEECAKESVEEIGKIERTNERMLHILKDQTTVVKSTVKGISTTSDEINKLYNELVNKKDIINEVINKTNTLEALVLSNKIHGIFTALLSQYSMETQSIGAIITAARTGVIHPSLMTPREMADHLTQIKLTLPINLNLPMGTNPNEIYELSKITKMAVFYKDSQIVFVIKLPLVTELELTLFRILPIPQPVETMINGMKNKNHSIVLKPEFQYVAITKNREQYTTFTETQLLHCTETEIFTICPEFSPVVHSNNKNPCEIALFKNPDVLPETCETGVLVLSKDIFYKLKHANTWIYTTKGETLTIACRENSEPYITKIRKQGLIWLSSKCRAYGNDIILNPTQEIKSKHYVNFIPEVGQGKISFKVSDRIKSMNLPKIMVNQDSHKLEKIHEIAQSLDKVQQQIDNEILTQSGQLTSLRRPQYEMVRLGRSKLCTDDVKVEQKFNKVDEQNTLGGEDVPPQIK
ncbi:uncharacterized protein LOC132947788 [Metopolophium dirhodum]|uniref:uncharacterized protein LOC132947788 n=1 Tax=Metopolophium dirhodum TaxID=44670 RepID=UPI00298FB634|nr:uncharacterized protein LOC132947788 [Metopolophium dirhodum]